MVGGVNDTSSEAVRRTLDDLKKNSSLFVPEDIVIVETPYRFDNISFNCSVKEQHNTNSNNYA